MKTKEIPYFTRSVDRAEKRFADYKARTDLEEKYNAVRHFIDEYGTATDKKYLLPKFTI